VTGLDSHILLRFLTEDNPELAQRARAFLEQACTPAHPGTVNPVVLAEVAWTLERRYRLGKDEGAAAIEGLGDADGVEVANADQVREACRAYVDSSSGSKRIGVCNYLILQLNRTAGCTATATLDRRLAAETDARSI
jgi:predicted nucleic-acid-binding protein